MNKIHSKVWNRALNQLVVVSELATSNPGGSAHGAVRHRSRHRLSAGLLLGLAALGGSAWVLPAHAQTVDCSGAPYNAYNSTASCMGLSSAASGIGATALGSLAHADVLGGLAVGYNSHSAGQIGRAHV